MPAAKVALVARVPSDATLKKYGLTVADFHAILDAQGGVCFVCQKVPSSGTICIDHYHCKDYKKLPPEKRKLWVRGLLCWFCNSTYVGRAITVAKAERVVEYLKRFESVRPDRQTQGSLA